jgi:hypothetical protein
MANQESILTKIVGKKQKKAASAFRYTYININSKLHTSVQAYLKEIL